MTISLALWNPLEGLGKADHKTFFIKLVDNMTFGNESAPHKQESFATALTMVRAMGESKIRELIEEAFFDPNVATYYKDRFFTHLWVEYNGCYNS